MGVSNDSRSHLARNTKTFLGIAGRGFGLGAMGLSYTPELPKTGEIGVLSSKFLGAFGRIGGGVSIGLDYFAYRAGNISKGQFQMNSTWTTYGLLGGPFAWGASDIYFIMGDLLGGNQRAKENFDRWQSYTPEQKREATQRSLDNKHGEGNLRNPKF